MNSQYARPYFDSSVFIGWIKGEVVKGVDRGVVASHTLTLAQEGQFSIHTSTLTLAEVHKTRQSGRLTDHEDQRILDYFEHDFIKLVSVDRSIGEEANRFCRAHGLYPNDAVHLACALRAQCDVLLAWDDRFTSVNHPSIRIEEPRLFGQQQLPLD